MALARLGQLWYEPTWERAVDAECFVVPGPVPPGLPWRECTAASAGAVEREAAQRGTPPEQVGTAGAGTEAGWGLQTSLESFIGATEDVSGSLVEDVSGSLVEAAGLPPTVGGIPTTWLLVGGAGLLLLMLLMRRR